MDTEGTEAKTTTVATAARRVKGRHISESAFVTGSMELKRNALKRQQGRQDVEVVPKMSDAEFANLATKLSLETIQLNQVFV